jgi:uncharacterized protein
MAIEVRLLGSRCNLACRYCYQEQVRQAGGALNGYDLDAIIATLQREGLPFTLFGGEPLLAPIPDLERLWALGLELNGGNGLQTNATLIRDEHIRLFKRYKVRVGISIDGPNKLNDSRWAGSLSNTRTTTRRSKQAIERLCAAGVQVGLIVTLHRDNAAPERLPILQEWLRQVHRQGVASVRLHLLQVDNEMVRRRYALSPEETVQALLSLETLRDELPGLTLDLLQDMQAMLLGEDEAAGCVWRACDPYTTEAVQGLDGNGQRSNCGRISKDGIEYVTADRAGRERYLALYATSQEVGGCAGCRFFLMCKGHCPGTAIAGDWRNRSQDCAVLKRLLAHCERQLVERDQNPLSLSQDRQAIEQRLLEAWAVGANPTIASLVSDETAFRHVNSGMVEVENRVPSCRCAWTSDQACNLWAPRIERVTRIWHELEWRLLEQEPGTCALQSLEPRSWEHRQAEVGKHGLSLRPLRRFRSLTPELEYPVAIGKESDLAELAYAWNQNDARTVFQLLGYPDCCSNFMIETCLARGLTDPTWLLSTSGITMRSPRVCEIEAAPYSNLLLRSLGLRALSHLPCSVACPASKVLAQRRLTLAQELGYSDEIEWLYTALAWPVTWSAQHGIAEIKTPVLKLMTVSDYTSSTLTVHRRATAAFP